MVDDGTARVHSGHVPSEFFKNGMLVSFDQPCRTIAPGDALDIRTPAGEALEIFPAAVRSDGGVSVWYAPHPLLRHWLGWLERIDDTHWSFHMEPHHLEMLNAIPELCEGAK
jgi:hypothetical protein